MTKPANVARGLRFALIGIAALVFSGCISTTSVVQPCCYVGEVELTRLGDLGLQLASGEQVNFRDIFFDFRPATGIATKPLPFRSAEIGLVSYRPLRELLSEYDANADTLLQHPELTVLYIHETARGLGKPLARSPANLGAIATAQADIGGMMEFIDRHQQKLDGETQRLLFDLEELGRELRTSIDRGPDNDEMQLMPP